MNFEAALFDLDGVLIDTESKYTQFWDAIGRKFGFCPTFAWDIKGSTLPTILATFFPEEEHEELENAIHRYEDEMIFELFEGVNAFLDALKDSHIPMAIVTSSDNKKMVSLEKQLPELTSKMDVVINGSMVTNSKPHPEGYLTAARKLGKNPSQCIVFEDSMQGLEAGRRAGCKVVGLATTNSPDKIAPLCDITITSWNDITPEKLGFRKL